MGDADDILGDAESLWKRGEFAAAWGRLDDLPAIGRAMPPALDLRLRLCVALGRWKLGEEVAAVLRAAVDGEHHVTAAEYCIARARHEAGKGERAAARAWAGQAVETWPGCRLQVLDDDVLMELF